MAYEYTIEVFYDDSCGVFVGRSDDIPGLTIEEETRQSFIETVMVIVPILLFDNLNIDVRSEDVQVLIKEYDRNEPKSKLDYGPTYSWKDRSDLEHAFA